MVYVEIVLGRRESNTETETHRERDKNYRLIETQIITQEETKKQKITERH